MAITISLAQDVLLFVLVGQQSRLQMYLIYNDIKQRLTANPLSVNLHLTLDLIYVYINSSVCTIT